MILHVVAFKLEPGIARDDARVAQAEAITRYHPNHIPEIQSWAVGMNVTDRPAAYDFGVIAEFADRRALDAYMCHPDHRRGVEAWQAISTWIVVDLELDAGAFPTTRRSRLHETVSAEER